MTREARPATRAETGRRERIPLGTPQQKLSAPTREGYVRRWINDDADRIHRAKAGGYDFVTDEIKTDGPGARVERFVGRKEDGTPMKAFLMEVPQAFYDEDQKAKQKPADDFDAALRNTAALSKTGQTGVDKAMLNGTESQGDGGNFYAKNMSVSTGGSRT